MFYNPTLVCENMVKINKQKMLCAEFGDKCRDFMRKWRKQHPPLDVQPTTSRLQSGQDNASLGQDYSAWADETPTKDLHALMKASRPPPRDRACEDLSSHLRDVEIQDDDEEPLVCVLNFTMQIVCCQLVFVFEFEVGTYVMLIHVGEVYLAKEAFIIGPYNGGFLVKVHETEQCFHLDIYF